MMPAGPQPQARPLIRPKVSRDETVPVEPESETHLLDLVHESREIPQRLVRRDVAAP
jgi:hypothetical protein